MTDDDSFSSLSQDQQDSWIRERTSSDEDFLLQKTYIIRRALGALLALALGIGAMGVTLYVAILFMDWIGWTT